MKKLVMIIGMCLIGFGVQAANTDFDAAMAQGTGIQGEKGEKGATGPQGPSGTTGFNEQAVCFATSDKTLRFGTCADLGIAGSNLTILIK